MKLFLKELNKIGALAQRDLMKLLRDKPRLILTFVFPIIFIGVFGVTLDSGFSQAGQIPFNYLNYVFTGILLQNIFQSSFSGIVSLISDREKDFSMSIFVAPVSRYSIVLGKIIGESLVSMVQLVGIIAFGYLIGVDLPIQYVLLALPVCLLASFVGASMGLVIASFIEGEENANRVFPLLVFPLIFTSGAFTPTENWPLVLDIIKYLNPIYYGVDLIRNIVYLDSPELEFVTNNSIPFNLAIFVLLGLVFFFVGTFFFTRKEGNH